MEHRYLILPGRGVDQYDHRQATPSDEAIRLPHNDDDEFEAVDDVAFDTRVGRCPYELLDDSNRRGEGG